MISWTPEADELLIALWNESGHLRFVADGMKAKGYDVTPNAIAGRRHRLGKEAFTRPGGRHKPPKIKRSKPMPPLKDEEPKPKKPRPVPDGGVDYFQNVGCKALLSKLGSYGLPLCCGKPRLDFESYCAEHTKLYTPQQFARKVQHG